ncbi:MliC family protein [Leptolyngbya sp. KIOST-1]|uniref:MliC family protein n=1 Tax=Leptolyngbya sp. KIOST-1 TaxID=1229172 RepID=UPI00068CC495|nr:MliC family protein [Leptolyngbya sp. KIOST-1]
MKSMLKTSAVALVLAGFALVGCNAPTDSTVSDDAAATDEMAADAGTDETLVDETVVFECPGGETITAQFVGTEEAVVTLPDQEPVTLPATEAASGARYSDGTTTLWNKGDDVLVEVDDTVVLADCTAQN